MMKMFGKFAAVALCALAMVTFQPKPAEAGKRGAGLAIGLAAGLLIGGALAHSSRAYAHPHVNYVYDDYDYVESCHRERYLVWKCWRGKHGRKHCSQVERLGKLVCY